MLNKTSRITEKKKRAELLKQLPELYKLPIVNSFSISERNVGRPTVMTKEKLGKLEQAFAMGCTNKEACLYVGINESTLYYYIGRNCEYSDRINQLKENPVLFARANIVDSIRRGNVQDSRWYLTKKRRDEF